MALFQRPFLPLLGLAMFSSLSPSFQHLCRLSPSLPLFGHLWGCGIYTSSWFSNLSCSTDVHKTFVWSTFDDSLVLGMISKLDMKHLEEFNNALL